MAEVIHNGRTGLGVMAAGPTIQTLTGVAAVVLAALGLAQFLPNFLLNIAIIVVGVGLFVRGGAVAAEYSALIRESSSKSTAGAPPSGGASAELLAGAVGIVLGILALLSITPPAMTTPVALIVLALGLMMNSVTNARISKLRLAMAGTEGPAREAFIREAFINALWADSSTQVLASIGALVLGAVALLGFSPWVVLSLVGIVEILAGGALTTQALGLFRNSAASSRRTEPLTIAPTSPHIGP